MCKFNNKKKKKKKNRKVSLICLNLLKSSIRKSFELIYNRLFGDFEKFLNVTNNFSLCMFFFYDFGLEKLQRTYPEIYVDQ